MFLDGPASMAYLIAVGATLYMISIAYVNRIRPLRTKGASGAEVTALVTLLVFGLCLFGWALVRFTADRHGAV